MDFCRGEVKIFLPVLCEQTPNLRLYVGTDSKLRLTGEKLGLFRRLPHSKQPHGAQRSDLPMATTVKEGAGPYVVVSGQEAGFPCENSRERGSAKMLP